MQRPPLGLQTIVFGSKYNIEDAAVLDRVKAAGYDALETGAKDPGAFRKMLDARKMRFAGSHVGLRGLLDVKPLIASLKTLGSSDLCNSALMDWDKRSLADYQEGLKVLNRAGKELRAAGIRLHYHNHDFEFLKVDGSKTGMDLLIDGLDPECVDLCVDVAWVTKGGLNPVDFLRQHKARVGYLHFKDYNADGWIELGQGCVDFAGIMKVLPELTGARGVICEQDSSRLDPIESVAISRRFLKTLGW